MSGTVTVTVSKKTDNSAAGYVGPQEGSGARTYKQENPGGGSPGAVDVDFDGSTDIVFASLVSPGIVRLENLSDQFAIRFGPNSGGSMVPLGRLRKRVLDTNGNLIYHGGVALWELEPGAVLTLEAFDEDPGEGSESSSAGEMVRVQVSAEER